MSNSKPDPLTSKDVSSHAPLLERLRGRAFLPGVHYATQAEAWMNEAAAEIEKLTGDRAQDQQRLFHLEGALAGRGAVETPAHPVLEFGFATCVNGTHGSKVTLGYSTLEQAQAAHKWLVDQQRGTVEMAARKFTGVGELERSGYIPAGSAAERDAEKATGDDRG